MNNRNNNKRSSIQKVDPKDKVSEENSTTSKKDFSSKSFINIVFNKYKILAYFILNLYYHCDKRDCSLKILANSVNEDNKFIIPMIRDKGEFFYTTIYNILHHLFFKCNSF